MGEPAPSRVNGAGTVASGWGADGIAANAGAGGIARLTPVASPRITCGRPAATNLGVLGASRFDLKYGMPGSTHEQLMTNIELYGGQVIPRVRELLG
jgi:hypothetical protein